MELSKIYQTTKEQITRNQFDLFIAASGYEARSSYIAKLKPNTKQRVVFGFEENCNNDVRKENDHFYSLNNYDYKNASISDDKAIITFLDEYFALQKKEKVSILVDYSSMTRCWYGSIIYFLKEYKNNITIEITFSYSRAKFTSPPELEDRTYFFEPISGFSNLSIPNNPTALLIGLGYERRRAFGLKEFFDAEETYIFYTDKDSAPDFYEVIRDRNKDLISQVDQNYIFEYPIIDLVYTKKILFDICSSLNKNYRVLITPCGPKPFTLLSLIVASELPNIDVWRISGEKGFGKSDRIATGEITSLTLEFNQLSLGNLI